MPDTHNLKEKRLILAHSFSPQSAGSKKGQHGREGLLIMHGSQKAEREQGRSSQETDPGYTSSKPSPLTQASPPKSHLVVNLSAD